MQIIYKQINELFLPRKWGSAIHTSLEVWPNLRAKYSV